MFGRQDVGCLQSGVDPFPSRAFAGLCEREDECPDEERLSHGICFVCRLFGELAMGAVFLTRTRRIVGVCLDCAHTLHDLVTPVVPVSMEES